MALVCLLSFAVLVPARAGVLVTRSDARGVEFYYSPGKMTLLGSAAGVRVEVEDGENSALPGEYDVPLRTVRVGLPQAGGYSVNCWIRGVERQAAAVARVVCYSWESGTLGLERSGAGRFDSGPRVVAGPVRMLRGVRFLTLELLPVSVDARAGRVSCAETMCVEVSFERIARSRPRADRLRGACKALLLNGELAVDWGTDDSTRRPSQFSRSPNWVKVVVDSTGLYGILGRDFAAAGVSGSIDPTTIGLYTAAEPAAPGGSDTMVRVPVYIDGADDGRLDADDVLLFYGLGASHWSARCSAYEQGLYTRSRTYWLTWGGGAGHRMAAGLGADSTAVRTARTGRDIAHLESDADCPARSGLLWIWAQLYKPADLAVVSFSAKLDVPTPIRLLRLSGRLLADSAGNVATLTLNGRDVGTVQFDESPPSNPCDFSITRGLPLDYTTNDIGLRLGGAGTKRVYVDCFDVLYEKRLSLAAGQLHFLATDSGLVRFVISDVPARAYIVEVSDQLEPRLTLEPQLAGDSLFFCHQSVRPAEFVVAARPQLLRPRSMTPCRPGTLSDAGVMADYWVIAPGSCRAAAEVLAAYRQGNVPGLTGATARVAVLEDVYDDYGFGLAEPAAVKRFIADKRPAYVLLVGDATYDYRGRLGRSPSGVPAYEYGFGLNPDSYDRSAMAFDAWYADFEGDGSSPDVILGRVTARTGTELRAYVDKLIRYETGPAGYWARRYLLLADDEFEGSPGRPDPIGFQHIAYCEAMGALPGTLLDNVKVYLTEYPYVGVKNKPAAHEALVRELNRGALAWVFFGHGAGFSLTHEAVFNVSQVPTLANSGRLPFCYFGSCSVGRFDDTQFECIAEELVRLADCGAIASVAASKATTSGSNQVFARNLLTPLFSLPDSSIGWSFFQAWPTDRVYHLFGDPAAVLRTPRRAEAGIAVQPDTIRPLQNLSARAYLGGLEDRYEWTMFGPRRVRVYRSTQGQTSYTLPGLQAGRGSGTLESGVLSLGSVFPLGVPLDTTFVPDGYYAPVQRSCRLAVMTVASAPGVTTSVESLPFARQPCATGDSVGPAVAFRRAGADLSDGDAVPASFDLEVVLADQSGVMCAPVPFGVPRLRVGGAGAGVDVADLLVYDSQSFQTARFRYPVRMLSDVETLYVTASDNALNQTIASCWVRQAAGGALRIDSVLLWPNPADADVHVTFLANRAGRCRARVYTLAGRPVGDTQDQPMAFGFNDLRWSGQDSRGRRPGSGVYLVLLRAVASDGIGGQQVITVRDKLVVRR
jgi:hypothetical protein